jgi:hypothetical protein
LLGNAPEPLTPTSKTNKRNNAKILILKAEEFLEEVDFYLTHTYMWFNGKVVHQEDEIPMGTEFSVFLAQWVLAYYEYLFINELVFNKAWTLLVQFRFVDRYIDDVFAIDCPELQKFAHHSQTCVLLSGNVLRGIYPNSLTLNKEHSIIPPVTGLPSEQIPMLDMHIYYNTAKDMLFSNLFDKRESPKLSLTPITKYSMADSMMSEHMSLNILYSQCFRYYGVCHQWEPFASACGGVLYELYQAGHNFSKLHAQMCRFFKRHRPLYLDVPNIQVHHQARVMFERYYKDGSPLLDHRNRWCGFEQRQATLTEVIWPNYPRVS